LKAPLGLLIRGSSDYTTERLAEIINEVNPSKLVSVGDKISETIIEKGVYPDILIVDNKAMRRPIEPILVDADRTFHLKNPAGTIVDEAWQIIEEAFKQKGRTRILVEGEEDLLTLVAISCAPRGSIVVYGQPNEGIVLTRVTEDMQERVRQIIGEMRSQS